MNLSARRLVCRLLGHQWVFRLEAGAVCARCLACVERRRVAR